jgi:hypothetical protein
MPLFSPPHPPPIPPPFCSAQLSSPLHCRMFFLARTFSSSCVLRLTPEARVRCACRVFTARGMTTTSRRLRSPSRHTTFVRLRLHLRRKSRRDKPSRSIRFPREVPPRLHLFSLEPHRLVEDSGPPPPLFGYGDIFGGYPDATSLRDMIPSRSSATPLFGLRARLGSGLDPPLPTTSEEV